jgi:NADPH:quinone reductase-like Zn-dependent oxidoreductase
MTTTAAAPAIPASARAIRVHAFGGNDQLKLEEVPVVAPGEGEVLVRVAAAGVNPVDWKVVRGYLHGGLPSRFPFVPGWEIAGTIASRGHGARRFEVGHRVYGYIRRPVVEHGGYAEYVTAPECYFATAPACLSLEEAAGIPLAGLTAYQCLHDAAALTAEDTLLVTGASGGVGGFAVQLGKAHGSKVIAVASEANREHCLALGADDFIAYDKGSLEEAFAARARTVDVLFDCSGGATVAKSRPVLKAGGRVASITARQPPPGFDDGSVTYAYAFVEPHSAQLEKLAKLVDDGDLKVHLQARMPLGEAAKALELSESGHTRGKVVLVNA